MPKVTFIPTKKSNNMTFKRSEISEYLIREQGYDEEVVREMPIAELVDLWEMYHED